MTEPLQGAALLAAAVRAAAQPTALLGPNALATISAVSTDVNGLISVEVTGVPGLDGSLVIPADLCGSWFHAEVATLGAGLGGIVGRKLQIHFQPGPDGQTQFTASMTVGG